MSCATAGCSCSATATSQRLACRFQLEPPPGLPESWSHLAEEGDGDFWFEFSWVPIGPDLVLADDQHALLSKIRK